MTDFAAAWRRALADLHRAQRNNRGRRRPQAASGYRVPPTDVGAATSAAPTATTLQTQRRGEQNVSEESTEQPEVEETEAPAAAEASQEEASGDADDAE